MANKKNKLKVFVLSLRGDNIVSCLAKNIIEAMETFEAITPAQVEWPSKNSRLTYVYLPKEPPRWHKRLRGESENEHHSRWKKMMDIDPSNKYHYNYLNVDNYKLWMLEEVPQSLSGKNMQEGFW